MRRILMALAVGGLTGSAMLAIAANPEPYSPETRAYVGLAFGGAARTLPKSFHYGLRMDYDRRYLEAPRAPMMAVDFDRGGLASTSINGMNLVQRLVLNQDEGGSAAEETGPHTEYSIVDWGLVLVGVAGIGFVASQVNSAEDSPEPKAAETPPPSGGILASVVPTGGALPIGVLLLTGAPETGINQSFLPTYRDRLDPDYQKWLDGGSGQMGDLGGSGG